MEDEPLEDKDQPAEEAPEQHQKNPHAAALAALGASKGGKARAANLSPEQRQEIAQRAAAARWSKEPILRAICGSPDRPLRIGDIEIPCYVLEDGRRVLSQRGLQTGIGMSHGGGRVGEERMAAFVASLGSKGLSVNELAARIARPILFQPMSGGRSAFGYEATVLPDICDLVLEARRLGVLGGQRDHLARQCEILVRGFARVGIIALVDEATGYQDVRARDALAVILERFISKELRPWVRTFPPEFYKEMFRLRGWEYSETTTARPGVVGKLTDNLIYKRLAPGVREELRRLTPKDAKGRFKTRLFQRLTENTGHPKLRELVASTTSLMVISDNWDQFMAFQDRAHPEYGKTMLLPGVPTGPSRRSERTVDAAQASDSEHKPSLPSSRPVDSEQQQPLE